MFSALINIDNRHIDINLKHRHRHKAVVKNIHTSKQSFTFRTYRLGCTITIQQVWKSSSVPIRIQVLMSVQVHTYLSHTVPPVHTFTTDTPSTICHQEHHLWLQRVSRGGAGAVWRADSTADPASDTPRVLSTQHQAAFTSPLPITPLRFPWKCHAHCSAALSANRPYCSHISEPARAAASVRRLAQLPRAVVSPSCLVQPP